MKTQNEKPLICFFRRFFTQKTGRPDWDSPEEKKCYEKELDLIWYSGLFGLFCMVRQPYGLHLSGPSAAGIGQRLRLHNGTGL